MVWGSWFQSGGCQGLGLGMVAGGFIVVAVAGGGDANLCTMIC